MSKPTKDKSTCNNPLPEDSELLNLLNGGEIRTPDNIRRSTAPNPRCYYLRTQTKQLNIICRRQNNKRF